MTDAPPSDSSRPDALPKLAERASGAETKKPRKQRTMSFDDALWALVGSATDAPPTDSSKKHEYLADAIAPLAP